MKTPIFALNNYAFRIYFIDPSDETYTMSAEFSTDAPHYEAAVAQALAYGQQVLRKAEERCDQRLFMRICKA